MFPIVVLAAALNVPPCWDIFDSAFRRSITAPHPRYISYNERIAVTADENPLVFSRAHIDYRADGTARVVDLRFNDDPLVTRRTEPGPPELGPYGMDRQAWLPQDTTSGLRVIAAVRSQGSIACENQGVENYKGRDTYHLVFRGTSPTHPSVKQLWVDVQNRDILKLIVSGYVFFTDEQGRPPLADFQVELSYVGPYLVVNHVVWSYRRHEYDQYSEYFGEYYYTGYSFPEALPDAYFAENPDR